MAKQATQSLESDTSDGLKAGDVDAGLTQQLVSAQNWVMSNRAAYNQSLMHRAEVINLAHVAGWSKYRIAKRLSITRRAVDEALERSLPRTALEFLDLEVKRNGGLENRSIRSIRELLLTRAR